MQQNVGRPRVYFAQDAPLSKIAITLTNWHKRYAKRLGDGNVSEGVRLALEIAYFNSDQDMTPIQQLSQYIPAIFAAYQALGAAMTLEQQAFVLANWRGLTDFLKTEEGKVAVQTFVGDWDNCVNPKPEKFEKAD